MQENATSVGSKICPKCGKSYRGYPATSREDNSPICPDCGVRESLAGLGLDTEEQEHILSVMHKHIGLMEGKPCEF